jgi:hypothetical protein
MLIYTALIPGHVVSQATAWALKGAYGAQAGPEVALEPICHSGITRAQNSSAPTKPSTPQKKCPFCAGYASFVIGAMTPASVVVLPSETSRPPLFIFEARLVAGTRRTPQNRGPPSLPA